MHPEAHQLSVALDGVTKALAEWTVSRLDEGDETLADRYGAGWRRAWVGEVESVLRHLSQAIAVDRSEVLARTLAWSGHAFAARKYERGDLEHALRCLREVIRAQTPAALAARAIAHIDAAEKAAGDERFAMTSVLESTSPAGVLTLRYLEAILEGRRRDAEAVIVGAARDGMSVPEIYDRVLRPALVEIGQMWHRDEITIADEHFATTTTEVMMGVLSPYRRPSDPKPRRLVATTVAGDLHGLGVRMVADLFEIDGWHVVCLGANTPTPDIVQSLRDYEAHLLALSVTGCLNLRTAAELMAAIRAQDDLAGVRTLVGGAAFGQIEGLARAIGADGWVTEAAEAVEVGNRLVES